MEELYDKKDIINDNWLSLAELKIWWMIYYPEYAEELIKRYCDKDLNNE